MWKYLCLSDTVFSSDLRTAIRIRAMPMGWVTFCMTILKHVFLPEAGRTFCMVGPTNLATVVVLSVYMFKGMVHCHHLLPLCHSKPFFFKWKKNNVFFHTKKFTEVQCSVGLNFDWELDQLAFQTLWMSQCWAHLFISWRCIVVVEDLCCCDLELFQFVIIMVSIFEVTAVIWGLIACDDL